jgi:glycosyltransferase involved in cell wall biosynthesis
MNRFTATLITLNEEQNLPRVLASLKNVADEIVVVDAGSTDRTRELAEKSGARVFVHEWSDYSSQRNFAAAQATHDWIFTIDADEELSGELRKSLAGWKQSEANKAGYQVSRLAKYLGRWIHHSGWYPDFNVRLYRRDRARYEGAIHERMVVDGPVGRLDGDLLHYAYRTVEDHEEKIERYTTLAAQEFFDKGKRRWRAAMIFAPPWALLRSYILKQGFRDGAQGWRIARTSARYVYRKFEKLGVLVRGGTLGSHSRVASGPK